MLLPPSCEGPRGLWDVMICRQKAEGFPAAVEPRADAPTFRQPTRGSLPDKPVPFHTVRIAYPLAAS
jgi:hypothetical protein